MKVAVFGSLVALALVGKGVHHLLTAPRGLAPRMEAWSAAFAAGEFEAAQGLMVEEKRGESWDKVTRILEREGWRAGGVQLGNGVVVHERQDKKRVEYALPRGTMTCDWETRGRNWYVDTIVFRGVREK